jgi:hypothetical protein
MCQPTCVGVAQVGVHVAVDLVAEENHVYVAIIGRLGKKLLKGTSNERTDRKNHVYVAIIGRLGKMIERHKQ